MPQFITIHDFPETNDVHVSTRDMNTLIHVNPGLRRYRDYLIVTMGPNVAYEHLTYALYRSLKNYFHDTYAMPYYRLRSEVVRLAADALMGSSFVALPARLRAHDEIRAREHQLLQEITGGVGVMTQGFFPSHWDALDRMRRLHAMRASLFAQEVIPAVPRVAEILGRELGGEIALPRFDFAWTAEQRSAIRNLPEDFTPEEVIDRLEEVGLSMPPMWDYDAVMDEICQAVIRAYLDQVEDDTFMDAWIERIRPRLNEYGEPKDEAMRIIEEYLADTERSAHRRKERLYPDVVEWLAQAEVCGHPIDPRALRMAGYPESGTAGGG